jgi:hypothetical protein
MGRKGGVEACWVWTGRTGQCRNGKQVNRGDTMDRLFNRLSPPSWTCHCCLARGQHLPHAPCVGVRGLIVLGNQLGQSSRSWQNQPGTTPKLS